MPRTKRSLAAFLVACFASASLNAGTPLQSPFRQHSPDFIRPTISGGADWQPVSLDGCVSDEGCADDSCCDISHCEDGCGESGCVESEVCSIGGLFGLDEDSKWKIGGWTAVGYSNNNVPLSQATNDLLSFNDVADTFLLNQQWLYAERVASNDGEWGLGGRVDLMYGVDAQKMQSFGNPGAGVRNQGSFDAKWDNGIYGWAMPQLYAEVANEDWSVKAGHFFTPLGYEVIPAGGNFFYSHSYTMFNSEPFTHTGVLATYGGIEDVTLYGGWTLGWDTGFDQLNSGNCWVGGFSVNATESVTFAYLNTFGNFGWRDGGSKDSYSHSIVLTVNATDKLQYVGQSDLLSTGNTGVSEFDTVGINQYLFYTVNDKLKLGGRYEWWKADGIDFYQVTGGVNIFAVKNLVVRPEVRHDRAPDIGLDESSVNIDAILSY
jgi:hypothetical protein